MTEVLAQDLNPQGNLVIYTCLGVDSKTLPHSSPEGSTAADRAQEYWELCWVSTLSVLPVDVPTQAADNCL